MTDPTSPPCSADRPGRSRTGPVTTPAPSA